MDCGEDEKSKNRERSCSSRPLNHTRPSVHTKDPTTRRRAYDGTTTTRTRTLAARNGRRRKLGTRHR